jgi:hypothetical protein
LPVFLFRAGPDMRRMSGGVSALLGLMVAVAVLVAFVASG